MATGQRTTCARRKPFGSRVQSEASAIPVPGRELDITGHRLFIDNDREAFGIATV